MNKVALVVTSINEPNKVLQALGEGAKINNWNFLIVGDQKSPANFSCPGATYYPLAAQLETELAYTRNCPVGHYARKNIGYLFAIQQGANIIVETDDDNIPRENFWEQRQRFYSLPIYKEGNWINVYRYFSDALLWPRGLPLTEIHRQPTQYEDIPISLEDCPIQQGLADENPDVDAIYRLILPLPQNFTIGKHLALGKGSWCPFNSQNTTWWKDAFPLLYLPAYCSFRMTDIWRSFVAQRIAWECGWAVRFHEATVRQERNEHNLMRDFADEIPGYLNNSKIVERLASLKLRPGKDALGENLLRCYEMLVSEQWVGEKEIPLLENWLSDLKYCT